jgi:predicted MFS family arabinose efflux permease
MAFSAAVQNLGSGLAVVIGGMLIVKTPTGEVLHYDWVGYLACAVSFVAIWASRKVKAVS